MHFLSYYTRYTETSKKNIIRLLITLASSLNPKQNRNFVGSQFGTDVNNKGADQTVARGYFCRLLITLANRLDPDQDRQCRPEQFDTDVNNFADSLFHKQLRNALLKLRFVL